MKSARAVPILMYHHVSPTPGLVTVSPENFAAQMEWLARKGWHTITTHELEDFLAGKPLPAKSVMITFDDGYLDNYVYAYPILRRFGLNAVIFLVTGWIGDGPARAHLDSGQPLPTTPDHRSCKRAIAEGRADEVMLRWSEVEAMRADGTCEFHSHTHTHTRWDQAIPDREERRARLTEDLAASRDTLTRHLAPSAHLCWPQGYFDGDYQRVAQAEGFRYLYTTVHDTARPGTDRTAIPRLVAKDRPASWLATRLRLYAHPFAASVYRVLSSKR